VSWGVTQISFHKENFSVSQRWFLCSLKYSSVYALLRFNSDSSFSFWTERQ